MPGITFAGFHDANPERAATVAAELGVESHPTLESLIEACDAVSCVVPTMSHHAVGMAILGAGRHLFVEKPIAVTLDEADALVGAAAAAGVVLQVGHVERFNRAVRAALPHIADPLFVQSDRLAPYTPRGADVAVVLDLMIHDIDLVATIVGSLVVDVSAVGVPVLTDTLDIANARLEFASGAVATITASRVSREKTRKLRIFQRSGYLSLDLGSGAGMFFRMRSDIDPRDFAAQATSLEQFVEPVPLFAPEGEPLRLELDSFVAAIRGEQPVVVSGAAGREALSTALRIVTDIEAHATRLRGGVLRPA
jgi:predicted dehydrogenase